MVRLMWLLWSAVCLGDPTFVWIADFVLSVEIQTKAIRRFVITEKAPTRAFSLGCRRKSHLGQVGWLA